MTENNKVKERLQEITEQLEQGIVDLFENSKYQEYLDVLGRFHNYSFNNILLIAMQNPEATFVAGYAAWNRKFGRHVKKGERGISIIAPNPFKVKVQEEKRNPVTKRPVLDENGKPVLETVEKEQVAFRVAKVFDVSQTDGPELTAFMVDELTGKVENYKSFMDVLKAISPVPIEFEDIKGSTHGYYHRVDKRIAVQDRMSELQTMKTTIHEIAHAVLHGIDTKAKGTVSPEQQKDSRTMEVEAESVAYTLCKHYGLDTSTYSFGYIAGWSSGKEVPELRKSLETIRNTSAELITVIDKKIKEVVKNNERPEQSISFYVAEDGEFHVLGEYHDKLTLQEAISCYNAIPGERMNAGKAIGYELHTGLGGIWDEVSMELFYGNSIDLDMVDHIEPIRNNELLWDTMKQLAEAFPDAEVMNQDAIKRLAADIAEFDLGYESRHSGYSENFEAHQMYADEITEKLANQDITAIEAKYQGITDSGEGIDEEVEAARKLLRRLDDIYLRRDRNPLTKVEELEEANYNQIDGMLNNMNPPKSDPKESVHERLERAKENVTEKKKEQATQAADRTKEELLA